MRSVYGSLRFTAVLVPFVLLLASCGDDVKPKVKSDGGSDAGMGGRGGSGGTGGSGGIGGTGGRGQDAGGGTAGAAGRDGGAAEVADAAPPTDVRFADGGDASMTPACAFARPAPTKMFLNGVPSALGGDRAGAMDAPYAVQVEIATTLLDGQNVTLRVDGGAPMMAAAMAGRAVFPTVVLMTEGQHTLTASCGALTTTLMVTVDFTPPAAPTNFAVALKSRRGTSYELTWTAPSGATTYDVRMSKEVLSAQTAGTIGTQVPFAGAAKAAGMAESMEVPGLYIETDYHFGVAASDAAGNRSEYLVAMGPKATFTRTLLTPPAGSTGVIGFYIDGSSDLTGDMLSDLLVNATNGRDVYLYAGSNAPPASINAPTVTFQGNALRFGYSAAVVGDVDGDGLLDIGITSGATNPIRAVYIFRGRATWPAVLTYSEADYVVTAGASYTDRFGIAIARLGDFDGDGVDDFAVSDTYFGGQRGRVTIVLGRRGTFTSFQLPDTQRSIVIDGQSASDEFGKDLVGMGAFYPGAGTTLAVGARLGGSGRGRVYLFRGQAGAGGVISVGAAEPPSPREGPAAMADHGLIMSVIAPEMMGSLPGLAIASPSLVRMPGPGYGIVDVCTGNAANPFVCRQFVNPQASTDPSAFFGWVTMGGFSGSARAPSLIGGPAPDLVFGSRVETRSVLYIVDRASLARLAPPVDITAHADVAVTLPEGLGPRAPKGSLVQDFNGDGFGDFAVAEFPSATGGKVVVFW